MAVICALHGFAGLGKDWQPLQSRIDQPQWKWHTPDLHTRHQTSRGSLKSWAQSFSAHVVRAYPEPRILLGYSMGGRLALHALLAAPEIWRGAIIVSAHPGLQTEEERKARRVSDEAWANAFGSREKWSDVWARWESQAVFQTGAGKTSPLPLHRQETDSERAELARSLRQWSLAEQEDLRSQIAASTIPTLWITGSEDTKFTALAETVNALKLQKKIVANAGHRVPWEAPTEFAMDVQKFVQEHLGSSHS